MNTTYLNVTVDWNAVEGQTKDEHFGINVYRAVADAGNSKYRSNMNYMSPGIIRFHNVDYMKDSSKDHGLIDTKIKRGTFKKLSILFKLPLICLVQISPNARSIFLHGQVGWTPTMMVI